MRESAEQRVNDEKVRDGFVVITATTYQMTERDSLVHCDTTDNAITVTLPPVGSVAGKIFTVYLKTDPSGNDVTVEDYQNDSLAWSDVGDITQADADDCDVLMSDGIAWHNLSKRT